MRGEYDLIPTCRFTILGSPPHARGIRILRNACCDESGITPACAGNTQPQRCHLSMKRDHPRMRGEYRTSNRINRTFQGSPPHARGILNTASGTIFQNGITPACAGNTDCRQCTTSADRDHPRMRGEYPLLLHTKRKIKGSPPHARGILSQKHI